MQKETILYNFSISLSSPYCYLIRDIHHDNLYYCELIINNSCFILKISQYLSQSNTVDTCCIKASDDKKIDLISINEGMILIRNKYFSL